MLWAGVFLVPVLIVAPPFLPPGWRQIVLWAFSSVCHQLPDRTFHVHGVSLAVCHRCLGVYAGLALALCLWPALRHAADRIERRALVLLAAGILPLGIDWGLGFLSIWENTPFSRTTTGLLFGIAAGLLLARALDQLGRMDAPPLAAA
ncbi:MAG: DUF2085 domain-containing protein [Rhodothermales bacterium]